MNNRSQSGQILLMTIMLLATVITVVMTVIFRSTSNTQLTKLQEESNKALVAAEAGLEKALRKNVDTYTYTQLGLIGSDLPGILVDESTVQVAEESKTTFVSPLVAKDQQYTFYMDSYNNETKSFMGNYFNGNLTFYFSTDNGNCSTRSLSAIELTLIDKDNLVTKKLIEPCTSGSNYITPITSDLLDSNTTSESIEGVRFYYVTDNLTVANTKVIIARVLFSGTKIALKSVGNLKSQGRNLIAESKATSGIIKKVQLFQSYPQLPAEFFVTSF